MSKDKINIDQLFQQLQGKNYPVDPAGFEKIKDQLSDDAWAAKFDNYEHNKGLPNFEALPLATTDRATRGRMAKGIVLLGMLFILTGTGIWYISGALDGKTEVTTSNTVTNRNIESAVSTSESATLELNKEIIAESKEIVNAKNKAIDQQLLDNPKENYPDKASVPYMSKSSVAEVQSKAGSIDKMQATTLTANKSNENFNLEVVRQNKDDTKNAAPYFKGQIAENKSIENDIFDNREILETLGISALTTIKIDENSIFNLNSRSAKINITKTLALEGSVLETLKTKSKIPFTPYVALGIGNFQSTAQFANTQADNGRSWELLVGLERKRMNVYSGMSQGTFNFLTTQTSLSIYDSFPHKNAAGDTIGWFRRNFRDTSFTSSQRNVILVSSIPLHFQYKVLQYKRFDLSVGAGINLNFYKQQNIFAKDDKNHSVTYDKNTSVIQKSNIGTGINAKIGFRFTPLTHGYLGFQTFTSNNISKINTFEIKPNGANLRIGIKHFIR